MQPDPRFALDRAIEGFYAKLRTERRRPAAGSPTTLGEQIARALHPQEGADRT